MRRNHLLSGVIGLGLLGGLGLRPIEAGEGLQAGTYQPTRTDTVTTQLGPGSLVNVRLQDGSQFLGTLQSETPDALTVATSFGEVKIARSKIKELTRVDVKDVYKGEYWYPDPNQTRSFVFPTASTLPEKKGSYENYYLIFNSLHVGLSNNVMLSIGIAPLPEAAILTFGPKIRVYQNPTKTVEAAIGTHFFVASGDGESVAAIMPYGVLSLGRSSKGRFNIGAGGIAVENERAGFLNLSGDVRAAKQVKLMGELFVLSADDETEVFPIYGFRFFSERLSVDLGFWNYPGEEDLTPIGSPLVSFVFRF